MFDVARHLLVVDCDGDVPVSRQGAAIEDNGLAGRAKRVAELGADVLICGAISRPLREMLLSAGVRVVAHRCGPVEDVLQAFLSGEWTEQAFLMPGCGGWPWRRRARRRGGARTPRMGGAV